MSKKSKFKKVYLDGDVGEAVAKLVLQAKRLSENDATGVLLLMEAASVYRELIIKQGGDNA
jgi:hypothetical protein